MKIEDLVIGARYVLTADVTNPEPDRRVKHDWRDAPVVKVGARFIVRDRRSDHYLDPEDVERLRAAGKLKPEPVLERTDRGWGHHTVTVNHVLFSLLIAQFMPYEPTLREELKEISEQSAVDAIDVLEQFVNEGALTRVAIREVAERAAIAQEAGEPK